MSIERLTPTPGPDVASTEKGLLIAVLLIVLLGVGAMLFMI